MSNWGKGAANNTIGWGQGGVNNSIGWGSVYDRSASGQTLLNPLPEEFILQINTALGDGLNQMRMPLQSTQPMVIDWRDGTVETVTQTAVPASDNWVTHTYASAGIYDIKVSNVDMVRFNNEGDKLKPLEVLNWGTYGIMQAIQERAFFGCNNLLEIADNGDWFDVVTSTSNMFQNNSLTSLPSGMELPLLTSGFAMFFSNSLTSLPTGMELPLLTTGISMFLNNLLTSLPSGMDLPLLTIGSSMFNGNTLTSLPSGMELPLLTIGSSMFRDNSITSLPAGMELPLLTIGSSMFRDNSITSLPSGMELPLLTNGNDMFRGNSLTSLPAGIELPLLTNGSNMFLSNTLNTDALSSLYIKMSVLNTNNNVPFHGGSGKFDPAYTEVINGVTYNTGDARADLVARGWTLTDGGAI